MASTEMHFLLQCEKFNYTKNIHLKKSGVIISDFKELNDKSKLRIPLGEGDRAYLAAQYISTCHNLRDSE